MGEHLDTVPEAVPLVLVGAVLAYAIAARRLERLNVTAPMVFVGVGVLVGESGIGLVAMHPEHWFLSVAELTLALLLFSDAAHLRLRAVGGDPAPPTRLLLVGLPLTIATGTLLAFAVFPSQGWATAALVAALVAPTDAALGAAVVHDARVPMRVRRLLNVESGLNDGLATPVVTVLIAVVASEAGLLGDGNWELDMAWALSVAVVVALVVGAAGGIVLRACRATGWTSTLSEQVAVLALALLCFLVATSFEANGFVAAFVGGMVFAASFGNARVDEGLPFIESTGVLASYLVWLGFGSALVGTGVSHATPGTFVVAVGALTLGRMLPVWVALAGGGWRRPTVAFVGWFGPRGLATVIFALIAIESLGTTAVSDHLVGVATVTVLLSIVLHGLSAGPLAGRYGRWADSLPDAAPERVQVMTHSRRRLDLSSAPDLR